MTKFCKDCKYFKSYPPAYMQAKCEHKEAEVKPPKYLLYGNMVYRDALEMRNSPTLCGEEAKLYEPKIL